MRTAEDRARGCYDGSDECFSSESWIAMQAKDFIAVIKEAQKDALLESAEIINTRMSLLETWGDDETKENIHIKEVRALRPVYDAILARAKEVEAQPHSADEKKTNQL